MDIIQTRRGIFVKSDLIRVKCHELLDVFVIKKKTFKDMYKRYDFCKCIDGYIRIPPFITTNDDVALILKLNNIDINKRTFKMPAIQHISCTYDGIATAYQMVVLKYLIKYVYFADNIVRSCILRMNTGLGKTHIAMLLINTFKVRTLVVIPSSGVLLEQWYKDLAQYMKHVTIAVYDATHKETNADILITMVNNLIEPIEPLKSVLASFSFAIYDEIHTFATTKRSNVFMNTFTHYRIGLTASFPSALTNLRYIEYELGPKVDIDNIPHFHINDIKFDAHVSLIRYHGDKDYTRLIVNEKTGNVNNAEMYKLISADMQRNTIILRIIEWLYTRHIKTFVFFDDKDSLYLFERILVEHATFNVDIKLIVKAKSKMTKAEIEHMNGAAMIILIIYSYGDTGLSVNDAYASIWYHPRKSLFDQKNGRILRINSDLTARRYIFDIIDVNTIYAKQLIERKRDYDKREFIKHKLDVHASNIDTFNLHYLD